MSKKYFHIIISLAGVVILLFIGSVLAVDKQHGTPANGKCNDCHSSASVNPSKLKASDSNLCFYCHVTGGLGGVDPNRIGENKPFQESDQAVVGVSGDSHGWSTFMPIANNADNAYGLRFLYRCSTGNPAHTTQSACTTGGGTWMPMNVLIERSLQKFGECRKNEGTGNILYCSTGNDAHNTKALCDAANGTWVSNQTTCESASNRTNFSSRWKPLATCSSCHMAHVHTYNPWDPSAPATYTTGGEGRKFLRMHNNLNQLCEECHYWMRPTTTYNGISRTNVKVYDGMPKSHPMGTVGLPANDPSYFSSPVEPETASWSPQLGGTRRHLNGGTDTNLTNNLVLDSTGKIRCMTCHGVHYTDSDTTTPDGP